MEERTIDFGGGRTLHAATAGNGPDVVLIHGALATSHDWLAGPFDRLVAEGLRVTAIDRPGHGGSRRPRFEGTPRQQAAQIRDGLDAIGIDRPLVVGHSFGGLVALAYAELQPARVAGLILVAPLAFPEPRLLEHLLLAPRAMPLMGPALSDFLGATIDAPMLKGVQRLMFSPQEVPAAWQDSFPFDAVLDPRAMVFEGEDASAILPLAPAGMIDIAAIEAPTHILTGSRDRIVEDERQAKLLARLMPNARLTEVEGVGHMLHHARPDLIVDAVRDAVQVRASARAPRGSVRSSARRSGDA